jgi:thiol-disulfide isomerase/thioredoxin
MRPERAAHHAKLAAMASRKQQKQMHREQLREVRLQQARRQRRQRILGAGGVVLAVIVVIAVIVVLKVTGGGGNNNAQADTGRASPKVAHAVQNVPPSVFDKVGVSKNAFPAQQAVKAIKGGKLTKDGKPEVVYVGADFCPFCAAERWPLAVALSRFGTFKNLGATESASAPEQFPHTNTLTFHGSSYTSKYLSFNPTEETTNQRTSTGYKPLEKPSKKVQQLLKKYDVNSQTGQSGGIPFVDVGNRWTFSVQYTPGLLKGMSHAQIAKALHNPSSKAGSAIIGSANTLTAAFCQQTGGKPGSVCQAPGVKTAAKQLPQHKAKAGKAGKK